MASHIKTRSVVRFSGPDTIKFLQGLIINDVRRFGDYVGDEKSSLVTPNVPTSSARSLYAVMLTPQGRFLFDLFLYEAPRVDERIDPGGSGPGSGQDEVVLLADVDCSVLGKWKTLNSDCTKFNAYYKRLQREEKSRESEMDILKRAKQMYRDEHKTAPFNNEEAWEVLRGHKKWDVPDPLDLTDDVPSQTNEALVMMNNHVPWAKHVSKKAKSESTTSTGGASTGGTSSSSQFGEAMASEYRIKRETALAAYRAAQVKDETITRLEEMKFLMIDTDGKDPNVVCWINEENDRIIKKYNLQPRY